MFPTLVYKDGGKHQCRDGTYDYCKAEDKKEFDQLLKDGWRATLEEAPKLENDGAETLEEETVSDAPPTREELEQMATELGIKFDKRMKDATILNKINAALEK